MGYGKIRNITFNAQKGDVICFGQYSAYLTFSISGDVTQIYTGGGQPWWYRGYTANSDTTVVITISGGDVSDCFWTQIR